MLEKLDGETRLFAILGDPIAQVKSPAGMTQRMAALGANAVLVPMHVAAAERPRPAPPCSAPKSPSSSIFCWPRRRADEAPFDRNPPTTP